MKKIIRLTESDLVRIVKRIIKENINKPGVNKISELKGKIETLLGYYKIEDNQIKDIKTGDVLSGDSIKNLASYFKTQIESILVGVNENEVSDCNSIKNEIITGPFLKFFGEYGKIPISKKQKFDYYTGTLCSELEDKTKRPWC